LLEDYLIAKCCREVCNISRIGETVE